MSNSLFTTQNVKLLADWGNVVYEKNSKEHHQVRERLKNGAWQKTKEWAEQVADKTNLEAFCWRTTLDRGWANNPNGSLKKIQKPHFKKYTWGQIYRKGERQKGICFTVGVSGGDKSLEFKIDKRWSGTQKLSKDQLQLFDQYLQKGHPARMQKIPFEEWSQLAWGEILGRTVAFVKKYLPLYDALISYVWENKFDPTYVSNLLVLREPPKLGKKVSLPVGDFKGGDFNFTKMERDAAAIGNAGEKLVIEYEKNFLRSVGKIDLAEMVKKVKDGKGYDIHSFSADESPKCIEVKTTTGKRQTPFFLSRNERNYYRLHPEGYYLYRIYNYSEKSNCGEFFILQGNPDSKIHKETDRFICWM